MGSAIDEQTAVDSVPEVRQLKDKLDAAKAELEAAESELDHLHKTLNPLPATSEPAAPVSEVELLKAQHNIPFARERFLIAKAQVLEDQQAYDKVRREAVQRLNTSRSRARLPFLRRLADALEEAAEVGNALTEFDLETVALGGNSPGHPFPDLSDSPPYRQGIASRVRQLVNELEQRS